MYTKGNIVTHRGFHHYAKKDIPFNRNAEPNRVFTSIPSLNNYWEKERFTVSQNVAGNYYSDSVEYEYGNVVQDPNDTAPGKILVQRYRESNFLLLGIPLVL